MKTMKRIVCMLLVVAMLAAIPVTASATGVHKHTMKKDESASSKRGCTTEGFDLMYCTDPDCTFEYRKNYIPSYHDYPNHTKTTTEKVGDDTFVHYWCADNCGTELFVAKKGCEHKHGFKDATVYPATCEGAEYIVSTCLEEDCDYTVAKRGAAALPHKWGEWVVTTDPTTSSKGEEERECEYCGLIETRPVAELPVTHEYATTVGYRVPVFSSSNAASTVLGYLPENTKVTIYGHTEDGTLYMIDKNNKYWIRSGDVTTPVDAEGAVPENCGKHDFIPLYVEPATCETKGYTTHKCAKCDFYKFSTTAALGHVWDEGRILDAEAATNIAEGIRRFYCVRTDETGTYVHSDPTTTDLDIYLAQLDAIDKDDLKDYTHIKTEKVAKIKTPYKVMVVDTAEDTYRDTSNQNREIAYIYNGAGVDKKIVGYAPVYTRFNVYAQTFDGEWLCMDNSTSGGYWIKASVASESDDDSQSCTHPTSKTVMKWAATCETAEFITNYCGQCGRITISTGAKALGHSYGPWETTTFPTTTTDGEEQHTCVRKIYDDTYGLIECGHVETRVIPAIDKGEILATGYVSGGEVIRIFDGYNAGQTHIGYATKGATVNVYWYSPDSTWCDISPTPTSWWVRRSDLTLGALSNNASAYAGAKWYGVTSSGVSVKVYSGPTEESTVLSSLPKGSKVAVFEIEDEYARISATESKWVKLKLIEDDLLPVQVTQSLDANGVVVPYQLPEKVKAKGTVIAADGLNVRKAASTLSEFITKLTQGTEVNLYEVVTVKGVEWGRVKGILASGADLSTVDWTADITLDQYNQANEGDFEIVSAWICLSYVTTDEVIAEDVPASSEYATGTVATGGIALNVRKKADVYSDKVGSLPNGTKVTIYDTKKASNGVAWGRISQNSLDGWVCMQYVVLDAPASGSGSGSSSAAAANASVANCATGVNVRTKADISGTQVGKIPVGTRIAVTKLDKGWGYVDSAKGWVYLEYVAFDTGALEALKNGTSGSTTVPSDEQSVTRYTAMDLPAVLNSDATLYSEPSTASTAKLGLLADAQVMVKNMTMRNGFEFVQISVGSISGWLERPAVTIGELTGSVKAAGTKVYKKESVDAAVKQTLGAGSSIHVDEDLIWTDGIYVWAQIGADSYIQLHNVTLEKFATTEPIVATYSISPAISGIVVEDVTDVLKEPNASSDVLIQLTKNTTVTIDTWAYKGGVCYGKVTTGNFIGWIDLAHIEQESVQATVSAETVNLYDAAGISNDIRLVLRTGDKVTVSQRTLIDNVPWGRMVAAKDSQKRELWGNLTGILLDGQAAPAPTTPTTTPDSTVTTPETPKTVTIGVVVGAETVNVRADAHVSSPLVATVKKGEQVRVSEQKISDGAQWGKIDQGWIAMQYVSLQASTVATSGTTNVATGTTIMTSVPAGAVAAGFVSIDNLAVRSSAGVAMPQVGSLNSGASVVIYETSYANNLYWGRTDGGWICMSYVVCTAVGTAGTGNAGTIARCFYTVNVRASAGTNSAITGKIMVGSPVQILETTTYSGELWGRTSIGWVAMQYVA